MIYLIQIERIDPDQWLERVCVTLVGRRIRACANSFQSLICFDTNQSMFVSVSFRRFIVRVHGDEFVKAALDGGKFDPGYLRRRARLRQQRRYSQ